MKWKGKDVEFVYWEDVFALYNIAAVLTWVKLTFLNGYAWLEAGWLSWVWHVALSTVTAYLWPLWLIFR